MKPRRADDAASSRPKPGAGARLRASLALVTVWATACTLTAGESETSPAQPNLTRGSSTMDDFWWADLSDRVRFTTPSTSHYFVQNPRFAEVYFFFPPVPPALHQEVPLLGSLLSRGPSAPAGLARYVSDSFYPMLGTWTAGRELPASFSAALTEYTTAKSTLQEELRSRLAELKDAPPEERTRKLADLARRQAPALAALEARAEKFRSGLLAALPAGPRTDWKDLLPGAVRQGDKEYSDSVTLIVQSDATLVAAYYQDGLDVAQRQLLRQTAYELAREARGEGTSAGSRWFSLTPFPSRLRLPAALPEALEARLGDFQRIQQSLVEELQQVLRDHRNTPQARTAALRQLGTQQAPRFTELEKAAEDIRRGLAALTQNDASAATAPVLPAELAERIAKYRRQRDESLKTLHGLLAGTRPEGKASPAEFERTQSELLEPLNRENVAIREALAAHMQASGSPAHRKSVDDLLQNFESARQQQEFQVQFRDYQNAVLLPGLSPAQRRLLFDAAVFQLQLPLPAGQKLR